MYALLCDNWNETENKSNEEQGGMRWKKNQGYFNDVFLRLTPHKCNKFVDICKRICMESLCFRLQFLCHSVVTFSTFPLGVPPQNGSCVSFTSVCFYSIHLDVDLLPLIHSNWLSNFCIYCTNWCNTSSCIELYSNHKHIWIALFLAFERKWFSYAEWVSSCGGARMFMTIMCMCVVVCNSRFSLLIHVHIPYAKGPANAFNSDNDNKKVEKKRHLYKLLPQLLF